MVAIGTKRTVARHNVRMNTLEYFFPEVTDRTRTLPVKAATDILGFILITSATIYIAYKNAVYKGPRYFFH